MTLSVRQMAMLSRLLDEALPLDDAGRRTWLEALPPEHGELRATLHEALFGQLQASDAWRALEMRPGVGSTGGGGSAATALRPHDLLGPYELLRLLGTGGMAEVWLARRADGAYEREVALKLPLTTLFRADLEQRFARERDILAGLHHPNIAVLFDAGFAQGGQPYLALEYVVGTPLTTHCDARGLSIRARLELFLQVLQAVQYAHARLVIHRDLKPSNILVAADGRVRLLDFGIAKLISGGEARETELTLLTGRALTPDYAAPEQIAGGPITTATDVYALGVILYGLLTGQRPYRLKRESRAVLEEAILQADPLPPSRCRLDEAAAQARGTSAARLARALAGDLDTITLKALKKAPGERYATADALAEDIARHLRGDIVLAQRDRIGYRLAKFARRHWAAITAVGIVLLTLAGGLVATSYEARIASAERDAALRAQQRALTQAAASRLRDGDVAGALGLIVEVLSRAGPAGPDSADALAVFHEARAADAELFALTGHADTLWWAEFSPDDTRIVTASWDGTARIWDARNGRELVRLSGHVGRVNAAVFFPDGRRVMTGAFDNTAIIWDAATGQALRRLTGHARQVLAVAVSPDGRRVATASTDKTARIWDAQTGRLERTLDGQPGRLTAIAFAPDGRTLVTGADDNCARIWDVASGRELRRLVGHTDRVWHVAYSPDGRQIATASQDKTARVWDVASGAEVMRFAGHDDRVNSAAFSPDGRRVVTASDDRSVRLWDVVSGRQTARLTGHTDRVWSARFSNDGRLIVSASTDRTARVWQVGEPGLVQLRGHGGRLWFAAYAPDGRRAVTASYDHTMRIWDTASGRELVRLAGHTDPVNFAAFSADGRRIVSASDDQTVRIWDAASGQELMRLRGHTDRTTMAAFTRDGTRVATSSLDNTARIWDAATGRELLVLRGHADRVQNVAYSPDDRRILTASTDRTARVWDSASGRQLLVLRGHTQMLVSAEYSPDGRRIVTASSDGTARIWDAASGRELRRLIGHTAGLNFAAFSADGHRVVTASDDRSARIWDADSGTQLLLLGPHPGAVDSAAFAPDDTRVLTAGEDGVGRIFDATVLPLAIQLRLAEVSQFDPLPAEERFRLGLPPSRGVRTWPAGASTCDEAAASPDDPDRRSPGLLSAQIVTDIAIAACGERSGAHDGDARARYQLGRALAAAGRAAEARGELERAAGDGYRAAQVELARLLAHPPGGTTAEVLRAIALDEQAWAAGDAVAGFELGRLYESGVAGPADQPQARLSADERQAWAWYQRAAAAGEANALARLGEREFAGRGAEQAGLLVAFRHYAAAAESARAQDWPFDAWRGWRYREASLARVLAQQGMAPEVVRAYEELRARLDAPRPPAGLASVLGRD